MASIDALADLLLSAQCRMRASDERGRVNNDLVQEGSMRGDWTATLRRMHNPWGGGEWGISMNDHSGDETLVEARE